MNPFIREGEALIHSLSGIRGQYFTQTSHLYTERVWFYTHVGLGYEPLHQGG